MICCDTCPFRISCEELEDWWSELTGLYDDDAEDQLPPDSQ